MTETVQRWLREIAERAARDDDATTVRLVAACPGECGRDVEWVGRPAMQRFGSDEFPQGTRWEISCDCGDGTR